MIRVQYTKREAIYQKIRTISEEVAARVMGYIKSLKDEEPALMNEDEDEIHVVGIKHSRRERRSFKEAFMDLW